EECQAAYEAAKTQGDAAVKAFHFDKPSPSPIFSPRFLAIAEKNPEGPEALDALKWALLTSSGPNGKPLETRAQAFKILRDHYATRPEIKNFLTRLTMYDDDDAQKLVSDVI